MKLLVMRNLRSRSQHRVPDEILEDVLEITYFGRDSGSTALTGTTPKTMAWRPLGVIDPFRKEL